MAPGLRGPPAVPVSTVPLTIVVAAAGTWFTGPPSCSGAGSTAVAPLAHRTATVRSRSSATSQRVGSSLCGVQPSHFAVKPSTGSSASVTVENEYGGQLPSTHVREKVSVRLHVTPGQSSPEPSVILPRSLTTVSVCDTDSVVKSPGSTTIGGSMGGGSVPQFWQGSAWAA